MTKFSDLFCQIIMGNPLNYNIPKGHSVRRYVLTMVLVQDVMTCCTAHGVTTTIKYRDMAADDCEVPSEILLSSKIYKRGLVQIIFMMSLLFWITGLPVHLWNKC